MYFYDYLTAVITHTILLAIILLEFPTDRTQHGWREGISTNILTAFPKKQTYLLLPPPNP